MSLEINQSFLVHGHMFLPSDRHCGLTETEGGKSVLAKFTRFNALNSKLNPICQLLAIPAAHHILHISRLSVKLPFTVGTVVEMKKPDYENMETLCKVKEEEMLRWGRITAESAFKNECECGQTSVHTS